MRGDRVNVPLSPHGISDYDGKITLKQSQSIWWVIGVCLGVLMMAYVAMSVFLSIESAPVYDKAMALAEAQGPSA
jgi:type VI protein secretion system component VasF